MSQPSFSMTRASYQRQLGWTCCELDVELTELMYHHQHGSERTVVVYCIMRVNRWWFQTMALHELWHRQTHGVQ